MTSRIVVLQSVALAAASLNYSTFAAPVFAPGDTIVGGRINAPNFEVGAVGGNVSPDVYTDNFWPAAESPDHDIDGVGQKYLNFAELNTGFIVTPSFNGGNGSVVTGIQLWTANDAPERDPASFELYGTNATISGPGPFALSNFTLINSGALSLPSTRNAGGAAALDPANSQTVSFTNGTSYKSYLVNFPTVNNEPAANSMQIAEVQLNGSVPVPEPGMLGLLALSTLGVLGVRRARR